MTGNRSSRTAKDDSPRHIRGLAPQLTVHEVRAAPQAERQRHAHKGGVGHRKRRESQVAAGDEPSQQASYKTAVEAHAADSAAVRAKEDLKRVREVVSVAIEQHVSQAPTDQQAEYDSDEDGHDVIGGESDVPVFLGPVHHESRQQRTDHIGQSVPVNRDGTRRERDGIEAVIQLVEHNAPLRRTDEARLYIKSRAGRGVHDPARLHHG